MKTMGQSKVPTFLVILAILIGIWGVVESRHPQPKNVQVSLRAKWSGTPLLLEAGELLANEQKDLYWEFLRLWLESDHHLALTNAKDCSQEILKHGSFLLSRALGSFFEFSLILRSASPKLVLYRQLAQESISSFFLSQKEHEGNQNISYPDMEKEFDRWELNRNPNAPDGKCCWVDLGSTILFDVSELSAWLSVPKALGDLTEEPEIFDFDHIYPESNKRSPTAILYGALGSSCFVNFHRVLAEASRKSEVQYIVRPVMPSGCESKAEYCSSVGTGNILNLGGYGVELALKNMEYKAIDDSEVKKGVILEDPRTEELNQEVRGFIFSKLLERKPELAADVMAFRDYLLSSTVSDTLEVWELKDLGYQSAQRIVQASDPLHTMQEINQNFPNLVSSLSRMKLNQSIKDEITANQRMVPPGKSLMAINGALISTDSIDLFSLLELIHGELSLADQMANVKVPQTAIKSLLHTHAPSEQSSLRVDFRSIHVHYLNNLEEDSMYRRWRTNLNELLMPVFPGQLHYIRKNLYHAVYVIDPSTGSGLKAVNSILYMFENNVPMRFGIILFSSKLAATIEENDGEIPEYFDKEQKIGHTNDGDDTSSFMISLFLYIKENYGIKMAFQFLSNVNNLWDADDDEVVRIGDVEQAFVETIKSKADSPPQNILLSLENEVNFKSPAYQSTLFVFKLGLSKIQPCLLMNGLVYPYSQEPDSAIQAMNEELVKIQEGIYYGHMGSNTDILEKFLSESGHPRYNPQIIDSGKGHQKFVSLCASVAKKDSVIMKLQYLHSPETENDVKPVTHLLAVDLTSKRGLKFLRNGIRYLLDGSRRARVGLLYNMDNLDSFSEQSPPLLLMKVIDFAVSSVRDHGKALHFLNQLIVWYESHYTSSSQESDPNVSTFIEEVSKLAESSDLKSEKLRSELSAGTWDVLSCKYYLQTVSRFLSLEFGLKPGDIAVITNGRVVLHGEQSFFSDDLKLLEAVEYDRRVKHIATVIEKVEWVGVEPDEITSDFISDRIMAISSAMAARSRSSDVARFEILSFEHSAIIQGRENAYVHIDAVIDPLSSFGQKIAPLLLLLEKWFQPSTRIIMNPMSSLADLPLKNFYRYVAPTKNDFSGESSLINGPTAWFSNMPLSKTLTMNLDVPEPWLVEPVIAIHDLDNIVLENLGDARTLQAVFELEAIVLTGHCSEKNRDPPRGLQLLLGTKQKQHMVDTSVMANLGYWQLKAAPGVWSLSLAPGRSADLYTLEGQHEGTEEGPMKKLIVIDDLGAQLVRFEVVRKKGKEKENLLSAADDNDDNGHSEGEQVKQKGWKKGLLKWASGLMSGEGNDKRDKESDVHREIGRHGDTINIFSVASGHLYERFLKIMILSVLQNTNRPVKFWFIKNYLSPQFKDVIPHMANEYGFEYELITYKWPTWLHKQTEKQRIIWAYKILFLDVIFPLSLKKVIYVDADQIVRADMGELYDMDIKGRPLAYTPFCDNNKEMDGYRFWRQGFWKDHLRGRPYHISALYVVDLAKFRQTASGDTLRVFYETLSKDPNSLSNLDQDLPNYAQHTVPIFSLPQEWLWCESWCGNATKSKSKTIDLCNNPMTKEPKLQGARRIVAEWPSLDEEARKFTAKILGEELGSQIEEPQQVHPQDLSGDVDHDEL